MLTTSLSVPGVKEGVLLLLPKPYGILREALALSFSWFEITLLLIGAIGGLVEGRKVLLPSG